MIRGNYLSVAKISNKAVKYSDNSPCQVCNSFQVMEFVNLGDIKIPVKSV